MTPRRHAATGAALGLALLVGVTACGGSDPAPSAHSSTAASSTSSSSPSSSPTITPATGVLLDNKYFRGHVPRGWQRWTSEMTTAADAGSEKGPYAGSSVGFVATRASLLIVNGRVERPIQQQAKSAVHGNYYVTKIVGYPTYQGRTWYHLTGTKYGKRYDYLGRDEIQHEPYVANINFTFPATLTPAQRQKVIDSVMTTIEFEK